jgi:hypothetical protein
VRYLDRHGSGAARLAIRMLTAKRIAFGFLADPVRALAGRPRPGWARRVRVLRECLGSARDERQRPR